ncbi:hypothetical protein [Longispora fulva]|uniref:Esterase n=1 Tax=Longispora fulva TaxID=619741 RepID=A0A8J7GJZ1_9ACTN|nr:hypothetical protein [Longispora fulva]MBG6138202.1 hypothetical protein [Longispora fulva]
MSLTATSTLVGGFALAILVVAGTVTLWRRWPRRARLVLRSGSLLLSQIMIVICVGLVVNRSEQLYPSLETLIDPPKAKEPVAESVTSGGLDEWLRARSQQGAKSGLAFPWQPAGGGHWPVTEHPSISLPAQYFLQPNSRFPVIVAFAPPGTPGWADARAAGRAGDPAIVVFVHPHNNDAGSLKLLGTDLPQELGRDLRTTPDRWSAVGIGKYGVAALDLARRHPERYRSAAAVTPPVPAELTAPAKALTALSSPVAVFLAPGVAVPSGLPVPSPVPVVSPSASPTASARPTPGTRGTTDRLVPKPADPLTAALRWAAAQLPAALDPAQTAGQVSTSATLPPSAPPLAPSTPAATTPPAHAPTRPNAPGAGR